MKTQFFRLLDQECRRLGGLHNAHLHLDRANTLDSRYVDHGRMAILENSFISLQKKHALIKDIHEGPAYEAQDLLRRVGETIRVMVECGTRRADTLVDVTADAVGLTALRLVKSCAEQRADDIVIRTGAYSPFGFKDSEPERWSIFERGVTEAGFIGCLPEADDKRDYPDHIGFEEHCVRMVDLASRTGKMLHVHTDQRNIPQEDGTERLVAVLKRSKRLSLEGGPLVWAVHMVSPSTYDERRWNRLVDGLLETNLGVICCPSAALGMRQIRPVNGPSYNSIPRVLELAAAGVPLRLGSDNVADICSPSTTANLFDEVFVLSAAIRFYDTSILAKFANGTQLGLEDRTKIAEHLKRNDEEIRKVLERWGPLSSEAQMSRGDIGQ